MFAWNSLKPMTSDDLDVIARRADALIEDHAALRAALVGLRKRHGLSQAVVAERMGVSQPTVAGFEHHDANPTLSTLRRYALAVGARTRTTVVDDCGEDHEASDQPTGRARRDGSHG